MAAQTRKSLNREARNREYRKITHENALILKRLQEKQPHYNVTRWAKEDQNRKKILTNICEYPYALRTDQTQTSENNYINGPPDFIIKKKNRTQYGGAPQGMNNTYYKKRGYTSGSMQPPMRNTVSQGNQGVAQIVKKETLYIGEHDLGNGPYAIEIIKSMSDDLVISA